MVQSCYPVADSHASVAAPTGPDERGVCTCPHSADVPTHACCCVKKDGHAEMEKTSQGNAVETHAILMPATSHEETAAEDGPLYGTCGHAGDLQSDGWVPVAPHLHPMTHAIIWGGRKESLEVSSLGSPLLPDPAARLKVPI